MGRAILIVLLSLAAVLSSCRGRTDRKAQFVFPDADTFPLSEAEQLSAEAIDDIVRNISSPVEIAALLQAMSVPFSVEYLAPVSDVDRITTNFEKALKLGIYGADLGYLNMYERTGSSVEVLQAIKKLADGIRVGQFFDFETLKRLSLSGSNIDSLLFISVHSFNQIDEFLRTNQRGHLSSLMITGVWLEAQYLATQVVQNHPDEILKNRIGEQKIILNDLMMLLSPYCRISRDYSTLCEKMELLREKYKGINITYTLGEPETMEVDGRLTVIQNEESLVEMTDQQLQEIVELTKAIRNELIAGR
ncbi:MAG: hypothetical protein RBS37_07610 [Bacteroidales bacterium]|jgi:hypothetical protein|nr:hypothetical protein [Bacteroidales bacterium]